jgi:hypothetical protein
MAGEWNETSLAAVMDVKHGFAFPGESIRDEPPGEILLTPGNFAIGGGFKGDKFKYFDGEVPEDYVLKEGELVLTMTDLSKQADPLGYPQSSRSRAALDFCTASVSEKFSSDAALNSIEVFASIFSAPQNTGTKF